MVVEFSLFDNRSVCQYNIKIGDNVDYWNRYESQNNNLPGLYYDMNHPSTYGAYLSTCVHYASIIGRKSEDNTYMIPGI